MDNHEKEPIFSAKNLKLLTEPLGKNNPITIQVLGICSALAVTVKLKPAIVMALSVIIVTGVSNFVIVNKPWPSIIDGIGNGAGYGLILVIVAFFRELLGSGTIYGYPVLDKTGIFNAGYENNGMVILPPMALIFVGLIIWFQRSRDKSLVEKH